MAYPYYQGTAASQPPGPPGYTGTHITFAPPPAPAFQPQSTWGGLDYYRAHAPSQDPALFQNAWDRVRQFDMASASGLGVGIHEARHWHRRAYGGMNELSIMTPTEIGHAAAYEAYRTWMHNQSMYEPLGPDVERQREGLIGLAVAESSRLLSFAGRVMDYYARQAASDAAAHTASIIFYQRRQDDEYTYQRGRAGSRYGDYEYEDEDPYVHDRFDSYSDGGYRDYPPRGRGRSMSRRRARSLSRPRSFYDGYEGTPYPHSPGMPMTPGMPPPMHPPTAGGMSMHPGGTPYPGAPMSFAGSGYAGSAVGGMPPSGQPYPYGPSGVRMYQAQPGAQVIYPGGSQVPIAPPMGYANSSSSGYSGYSQGYPSGMGGMGSMGAMGAMPMGTAMSQGSMGGMVQAPPQTIVIHKSRRHRHHHRSRSRGSA